MHLHAPVSASVVGVSVHESACVCTCDTGGQTARRLSDHGMSRSTSRRRQKAVSRRGPRGARVARRPGCWAPAPPGRGGPQRNLRPRVLAARPRSHGNTWERSCPGLAGVSIPGTRGRLSEEHAPLHLSQRTQHRQAPRDRPFARRRVCEMVP